MFKAVITNVTHTPTSLTAEVTITADGFDPQILAVDCIGKTVDEVIAGVRASLAGLNATGETAKALVAHLKAGTVFEAA